MTDEQWQPVPGYEGYYEVSDHGRVRSVDRVVVHDGTGMRQFVPGRILRANPRGRGSDRRLRVALSKDGKARKAAVHALVLSAFVGPRPDGTEGCHSNGDNLDNRLANLRWDTHLANVHDQIRHGTHNRARPVCLRGHPLTGPNLRPNRHGWRVCLACYRARLSMVKAARRGEPFDFQAAADREHAALLRQAGVSDPLGEAAPPLPIPSGPC